MSPGKKNRGKKSPAEKPLTKNAPWENCVPEKKPPPKMLRC